MVLTSVAPTDVSVDIRYVSKNLQQDTHTDREEGHLERNLSGVLEHRFNEKMEFRAHSTNKNIQCINSVQRFHSFLELRCDHFNYIKLDVFQDRQEARKSALNISRVPTGHSREYLSRFKIMGTTTCMHCGYEEVNAKHARCKLMGGGKSRDELENRSGGDIKKAYDRNLI